MVDVSAADRAARAQRCARKLGMPSIDDVPYTDPLEQVVSRLCAREQAWQFRDGMRLRLIRRFALGVLKPFTERQESDAELFVLALALMSDEIQRLRARLSELESGENSPESSGREQ